MQDSRAWHMGFGFGVHRVFRLSPMFGGGGGGGGCKGLV